LTQTKRLLFPDVGQVVWEEFLLPAAPAPYEIVVEADTSLVSVGTELALYTGSHIGFSLPNPPFPMMPQRPGYALVGRVLARGEAVQGIHPGQRVLAEAPHGKHAVLDVRHASVTPLPEEVDDAQAALARMAYIALTAARVAPIHLGQAVAIYGLGLVGQLAAQLCRLHGANPVIGIDRLPERLAIAQAQGIKTIAADQVDVPRTVSELNHGRAPDVVVEATGSPDVASLALDLVAPGGRVVLLGSTRGRVDLDVYSLIHRKGVRLLGAHESVQQMPGHPAARQSKPDTMRFLIDLFAQGALSSRGLITHTLPAGQALPIYDALAAHPQAYLGVLLDWRAES
jgi:2-desacetyl-2-hydroxyethyl bacteriochlorophyllide A dehydrogenase